MNSSDESTASAGRTITKEGLLKNLSERIKLIDKIRSCGISGSETNQDISPNKREIFGKKEITIDSMRKDFIDMREETLAMDNLNGPDPMPIDILREYERQLVAFAVLVQNLMVLKYNEIGNVPRDVYMEFSSPL